MLVPSAYTTAGTSKYEKKEKRLNGKEASRHPYASPCAEVVADGASRCYCLFIVPLLLQH
jgi:hypothetical protein